MGLDSSEIYAGSLVALAGVGAGAVFVRRAWAWRAELLSLIAASLLWAGFLIIALRSSAVGEDCSEPHHEGELPMLIVTLVWTAILIAALRAKPVEVRILVRFVPALGTAAVAVVTVCVLLAVRPAC
jgi:hypothetical protein